jgi:hypothetical protein
MLERLLNDARIRANRRWVTLLIALVGVLFAMPALFAGLTGDDYFHRIILTGSNALGDASPWLDLFSFAPAGERGQMMVKLGILPWWADPVPRIALFRPATAATHVLDYAIWPNSFGLQHAHSLIWYGLGVGLVVLLYRRVLGTAAVAILAGLMFALEDAHAMPAGWIANRNALLCLVFGVATLLVHLHWQRKSRRPAVLAGACALLVLGLACGEAALGCLAYVFAWQVCIAEGSIWRRLAVLSPYGIVVITWRALYGWLGYGVAGSTLYLDPVQQPAEFAAALAERLPLLLAGQWLQLPTDVWLVFPRWIQLLSSGVAVVLISLIALVFVKLLRGDAMARFWALGMVLSLVPLCAAFPMDRLLIFSGIGAFALLAMLVEKTGLLADGIGDDQRWPRRVAAVLVIMHLPLAAFLLAGRTALLPVFGEVFSGGAAAAPRGPEVADQTFVFVNGNDFLVGYTYLIRGAQDETTPRGVAQLASIASTMSVLREDASTLVIEPDGGFLKQPLDGLLKASGRRFVVGERITRSEFYAEIRAVTEDHRPQRVAFVFGEELTSSRLRFLYWSARGELRPFVLPAVNEEVRLPRGPLVPAGQ